MIRWDVGVGNRRFKEGHLQILHLAPVDDMRVQIQPKTRDEVMDVVDSEFTVPAAIEMDRQRAQAQLHGLKRKIRAIDPTGHSDHAVVGLSFAGFLDPRDDPVELPKELTRLSGSDLGSQLRLEPERMG